MATQGPDGLWRRDDGGPVTWGPMFPGSRWLDDFGFGSMYSEDGRDFYNPEWTPVCPWHCGHPACVFEGDRASDPRGDPL